MKIEKTEFELSKDRAKAIVEYKGFIIIVDNFLEGMSTFDKNGKTIKYGIDIPINYKTSTNNYYQIWENGKCLSDTLVNDDAMWTIDEAVSKAKNEIDAYLNNNRKRVSKCWAYL